MFAGAGGGTGWGDFGRESDEAIACVDVNVDVNDELLANKL